MDKDTRACPGCSAPTTAAGQTPPPGAILSCTLCGFTGVWEPEIDGWRKPTPAEHAELIQDEDFLRIQEMVLGVRMFRAQETEDLIKLVSETIAPAFPKLPGIFAHGREKLIARIAEATVKALLERGYHRHPTKAERELFNIMEDLG